MFFALLLSACDAGEKTDDTATAPSACECEPDTRAGLTPVVAGGFDDWSGTAVAWAVDVSAGRALVVAAAFELPAYQVEIVPACDGADDVAGDWAVAVPPSASDDVATYPLLGTIMTDAAGAHSLVAKHGALLVEGDLASTTPDRVLVATGGTLTMLRGDGGNRIQGALDFAAVEDPTQAHADDDCDGALTLTGIDIDFTGSGSE
jgi:hypothetical protein